MSLNLPHKVINYVIGTITSCGGVMIMKRERKRPRNVTSRGDPQYQYYGSILIISGKKKIAGHVNQIYIK